MIDIANDTRLAIDVIRTDGGTQPRAELNQAHLEELVELLQEGHIFKDKVVVFYDGTNYWLADGFHRLNASKRVGLFYMDTDIRSGTLDDAIEYSCGANATHGLRRTNDDKRRAVNRLFSLLKWQERSNREIARQCGVTEFLVRTVRGELPEEHPSAIKSQKAARPLVERDDDVEEVRIRTADMDAEKRKVVHDFFTDYPTLEHLSNREIARRCDVTEGLVRKIRKELQEVREKAAQEQAEAEIANVVVLEPIVDTIPNPEPEIVIKSEAEQKPPTDDDIELSGEQISDMMDEGFVDFWHDENGDEIDIDGFKNIEGDIDPEQDPQKATTPEPEDAVINDEVPVYSEWKEEQVRDVLEIANPEPDTSLMVEPEIVLEPINLQVAEAMVVLQQNREIKREQQQERIEELRSKGVALPIGKYSCIVIDPPWQMQKIERDERPNQVEFDYPTMNEDQLKAFALPDMAADDCHLYLWTTQKHLPLALRLADHWGFKYQCLMTWVKNVGFTPFSWMYSTEHVLFCTKGSLPLLQKGRRLDFGGKVREHSRKPDEFYDLVKEVSPGPRIDVFSREKRDGFDQYGNEVEKYVS